MSYRAEAWAWEAPAEVGREELLVLLVLAHAHNDETGKCYPSIQFIARKARQHRATVYRSLEALQHVGLITVKQGGGRKANEYGLFGVGTGKYPAERGGDGTRDIVESYPHRSQPATGAVAPGATQSYAHRSQPATAPRASCATAPRAPGATPTGIEQEDIRPRFPTLADGSVDTRIPDAQREIAAREIARIRAQLTGTAPNPVTHAPEAMDAQPVERLHVTATGAPT